MTSTSTLKMVQNACRMTVSVTATQECCLLNIASPEPRRDWFILVPKTRERMNQNTRLGRFIDRIEITRTSSSVIIASDFVSKSKVGFGTNERVCTKTTIFYQNHDLFCTSTKETSIVTLKKNTESRHHSKYLPCDRHFHGF